MITPRAPHAAAMPSSRQRLRADRRLPSALIGLLAIVLVTTGLAWTFLGLAMRSLESVLHDRVEALALIHTVNDEMQHQVADLAIKADRQLITTDSAAASVRAAQQRAQEAWTTYLNTWFTPEEAELVARITPVIDAGFRQAGRLADTLQTGRTQALPTFLDELFFREIDAFSSALRELVALQVSVTRQAHALSQARFRIAGQAFLAAVIAASVLVVVALLAGGRRTPHATRRWAR